jgi:4'-phosphopantetheinyl transferase EntD
MTGAPSVLPVAGGLLPRLFAGQPAITDERPLPGELPLLETLPEEAAQIASAVRGRRIEYLTGRGCARRALGQMGISGFALLNGPDRAPRWPPGVVGSLTHTGAVPGGFCGVVVARADDLAAVGLDAEEAGPLNRDLWRLVLTDGERRAVERDPDPTGQGAAAKIIFSAKECFYKAQYPLTGQFLQFRDVEIALDQHAGTFEARPRGGAPFPTSLAGCVGRYLVENGLVLTGMAARP